MQRLALGDALIFVARARADRSSVLLPSSQVMLRQKACARVVQPSALTTHSASCAQCCPARP